MCGLELDWHTRNSKTFPVVTFSLLKWLIFNWKEKPVNVMTTNHWLNSHRFPSLPRVAPHHTRYNIQYDDPPVGIYCLNVIICNNVLYIILLCYFCLFNNYVNHFKGIFHFDTSVALFSCMLKPKFFCIWTRGIGMVAWGDDVIEGRDLKHQKGTQ